MTLEEFTNIVEIYGADARQWPAGLRDDCEAYIADSPEARTLIDQQRELDRLMDQLAVPAFPNLKEKVLHQELPDPARSLIDQLMNWLLPENNFRKQLWHQAMAACLPLVFGILLGNYFTFGVFGEAEAYFGGDGNGDEYEYWEDELTMLSLTDYSESEF